VNPVVYYVTLLAVYGAVYAMACAGLSLEFGITGVINFGYIIFQAAGAYTAAILTLGPSSPSDFQHYVGGSNWPFPLPLVAAAVVGAVLSAGVALLGIRRLRSDYLAIVLLVASLIATTVATNATSLVGGDAGLALVPHPLVWLFGNNAQSVGYNLAYAIGTAVLAALCLVVVHRITESPYGRRLRALRENEFAAAAQGISSFRTHLVVVMVGGAMAGLSGGLLVQYISAWAPSGWLYPETFVFFTALIVGGMANNWGALLGAILVPLGIGEGVRYLPTIGSATLTVALQWIVIGLLPLFIFWFRPQGIIPERRRRFVGGPGSTSGDHDDSLLTESELASSARAVE
jgi:branched-chain amino acid transport system permease protein